MILYFSYLQEMGEGLKKISSKKDKIVLFLYLSSCTYPRRPPFCTVRNKLNKYLLGKESPQKNI